LLGGAACHELQLSFTLPIGEFSAGVVDRQNTDSHQDWVFIRVIRLIRG
jgi:hypothetical protein